MSSLVKTATKRDDLLRLIARHESIVGSVPEELLKIKAVKRDIVNFRKLLKEARRKPRVAVIGNFNSGKSTFINSLLGRQSKFENGQVLPVDYVPCTKGPCIVTAPTSEFPDGTVRIVFETDQPDLIGDSSLLKRGAHHEGDIASFDEIIVYANSPILQCLDLVDTPGFDSGFSEDEAISQGIAKRADLVIFLSVAAGAFCGDHQANRVAEAFNVLRRKAGSTEDGLRRLFIVASQWDNYRRTVPKDEPEIRLRARTFAFAARILSTCSAKEIDQTLISQRMYAYDSWLANDNRSLFSDLPSAISHAVETEFPTAVEARVRDLSMSTWQDVPKAAQKEIDTIKALLDDANARADRLKQARAGLQDLDTNMSLYVNDIGSFVDDVSDRHVKKFSENLCAEFTQKKLESLIRKRWENEKEAKAAFPAYLQDILQSRVESFMEIHGTKFSQNVDRILADIQGNFGSLKVSDNSFDGSAIDVRGFFIGGLGAAAALGAMAFWASSLGNLAGYIIVAQVASLLSALGISVGGTASLVAFIAGTGGPVGWGIGLAILLGVLAKWIFGDSWQTSLSKRAAEQVEEKAVKNIERSLRKHFSDGLAAFKLGLAELQKRCKSEVDELETYFASFDREEEKKRQARLVEALKGLTGMLREFGDEYSAVELARRYG